MKNFLSRKRQVIEEALVVLLFSLTPLVWLSDNQVIIGHDSGFRLKYVQYLVDLFYSWNPYVGFGADLSINKGFLITQLPETLFSYFTGSLHTGQILTFIFWFFLMGLSMYIFTRSFFPDKKYWILRLFSSTFYMYNFFILQGWFIAERAKFSLYAALPLGFLILYKTFTKDYSLLKGTVLFSLLFFFLNGGSSPPLYGSLFLTYGTTVLYFTFVSILKKDFRKLFHYAKVVGFFALGFFFINAYWVVPQLYLIKNSYASSLSLQGGIEGVLGWESVVSKYASFMNLFRLQGIPDWYENQHHQYSSFFIDQWVLIIASFFPLILIVFGFYSYKKFSADTTDHSLLFLIGFLFFISIFFTAGSHPPFGFLYVHLMTYLPGFAIFRSAFYKFGPAFWFSVIFLSGYFLNVLLLQYIKKQKVITLVGITAIGFLLIYHFPFFVSDFFRWNDPFTTRVRTPSYIFEISKYINTQTSDTSRVFLLPSLDKTIPQADSYEWGYWSLDMLPVLALNRSVIANTYDAPAIVHDLYSTLEAGDIRSFEYGSSILGIDKALWRDDVLYNNKYSTTETLMPLYQEFLSEYKNKIQVETGKWRLYKNNIAQMLPLFYASETLLYTDSDVSPLDALVAAGMPKQPSFIKLSEVDSSLKPTILQNSSVEILAASCVFCEENLLWDLQRNKELPPVRFLPGSLFYFLVTQKEERLFQDAGDNTGKKIDVFLSMATDRLRELAALVRDYEKNQIRMYTSIQRYETTMTNAQKLLNTLPEPERNDYNLRLLHFYQMHHNFLGSLDPGSYFSDIEFQGILSFIQKKYFRSSIKGLDYFITK